VVDWYRMRVIRVLCLASLLALVVFSGAVEPGALADVVGVEEPSVTTEAEDETRQDAAGVRITMTGVSEDADDQAGEDTAGIRITMTGEEEEADGPGRALPCGLGQAALMAARSPRGEADMNGLVEMRGVVG